MNYQSITLFFTFLIGLAWTATNIVLDLKQSYDKSIQEETVHSIDILEDGVVKYHISSSIESIDFRSGIKQRKPNDPHK